MSKYITAAFAACATAALTASAFAASPTKPCPWATNGYVAKESDAVYRFIFSPKCDILVLSINGSEPKEVALRSHPQGWIHTTPNGKSFVFGPKGKRVTRIDTRGQKTMRMKPAY